MSIHVAMQISQSFVILFKLINHRILTNELLIELKKINSPKQICNNTGKSSSPRVRALVQSQ
uniref:Uncharacterized protein n=1 Tax=Rhizophora mucronata TaxID=61149 RepID=A0A2P2QTL0_RHIMU